MIYTSLSQLIGNTPLLELTNIERDLNLKAKILAKLECFNPGGSTKDRAALYMLNEAEKEGKIDENSVIIEPTSGNTGIGLACVATTRGYRVIIVMPDSMSIERQKIMQAYGAELVLTDGKLGMKGTVEKAEELLKEIPSSIIAGQFSNPANPKAHYETTGPEIYSDTNGSIDYFVAGVGTGGTLTGTGRYLKEKNNEIKIIAVEPKSSPMITKGVSGQHKIQGIGSNFIPKNFDRNVCDEILTVEDEDALYYGRMVAKKEGILVGISSGAALSAAIEIARKKEAENKNVVVLFPDTGTRYISTELFE